MYYKQFVFQYFQLFIYLDNIFKFVFEDKYILIVFRSLCCINCSYKGIVICINYVYSCCIMNKNILTRCV